MENLWPMRFSCLIRLCCAGIHYLCFMVFVVGIIVRWMRLAEAKIQNRKSKFTEYFCVNGRIIVFVEFVSRSNLQVCMMSIQTTNLRTNDLFGKESTRNFGTELFPNEFLIMLNRSMIFTFGIASKSSFPNIPHTHTNTNTTRRLRHQWFPTPNSKSHSHWWFDPIYANEMYF